MQPASAGRIIAFPEMGGLHHRSERRTAGPGRSTNQRTAFGVNDRCIFRPAGSLTRNGKQNFIS